MAGKKILKIMIILIIFLILIGIIITGTGFFLIKGKLDKIQRIDISDTDLGITETVAENLETYRNIAIFGVDSSSDDYGIGNRSDCIIIASINNNTGDIKLISVYRDTYVNIDGYGLDKITHAYSYGEAPLAIKTLNQNLDLNIEEFVTVNFDAVVEAVDKLEGVEITIEENEVKHINNYINSTSQITGKKSRQINKAGTYVLDGVQAVAYSRIRYTEGGDYKRTERMRTVIEAMLAKLKTRSISQINSFADTILPDVYTNIKQSDIFAMIPSISKYRVTESIGWPYNTKGKTMDRWYGIPTTLETNVIQLHNQAFGNYEYVPSQTVKTISENIIKKTGYTK
ncbi:MAG: LytR family transcriptional regulator [Clostridia bacterium]|nr:LytR family transcriptional regulator [Clostridia bacterium]